MASVFACSLLPLTSTCSVCYRYRSPLLLSFSRFPSSSKEWHLPGTGFITLGRPHNAALSLVFAKPGSRSALYGNCEDYVLIEPGQDETFVNLEELRGRLKGWLENWPGKSLPDDLAAFGDLDAAVTYLIDSACELEICDGSGVVQWFEVRL